MVEENTTTCACQGGWMCPNCADQHRAEISRLKAELEELQSAYDELRLLADGRLSIKPEYVRDLERQLAEARAEVERWYEDAIEVSNRNAIYIQEAKAQARREAARQIIQYIIDQGIIEVGWNKQQVYEIDRSDIDELRQRYGLEG